MTSPFGDVMGGDGTGNPAERSGRPSSLGYWLGGLLIVGGIVGGIVWIAVGLSGFSDSIDDFERVPVGQVGSVELEEGDYIVYAERGGGLPQSNFIDSLRMRPAGEEGRGEEIEFADYVSEFTYDFGGRAGRAQLTFAIDDAGEYLVRADDGPGTTATTVAFGPSVAGDLVSAIVGLFVIAGIGIILGIILIVVTGIRRRKWRQRSWMDGAGGTAYGNQPGVWNPGAAAAPPGAWGAPAPPGYEAPPPPGGGYPPPPG